MKVKRIQIKGREAKEIRQKNNVNTLYSNISMV